MSDNPYQSPSFNDDAARLETPARRTWLRNFTIVAWLAIGAPGGWAAATLLWRAGYLFPSRDATATFLVMVGPMILTAVYGARHNREVLPRLIAFPVLGAGFVWFLLAPTPSMVGLSRLYVNEVYPYFMVPAAIGGGVLAVLTAKSPRSITTTTVPAVAQPRSGDSQ